LAGKFCNSWTEGRLRAQEILEPASNSSDMPMQESHEQSEPAYERTGEVNGSFISSVDMIFQEGDYVAAVYDNSWFVDMI